MLQDLVSRDLKMSLKLGMEKKQLEEEMIPQRKVVARES
jgi:hypothetical protein